MGRQHLKQGGFVACKDRTRGRACPLGGCPAALLLGLFASAASVLRAGASPSRFPVSVRARGRLRGECLHRQSRSFSNCRTEPPAAPFKGQKSAVVLHPPPHSESSRPEGESRGGPESALAPFCPELAPPSPRPSGQREP